METIEITVLAVEMEARLRIQVSKAPLRDLRTPHIPLLEAKDPRPGQRVITIGRVGIAFPCVAEAPAIPLPGLHVFQGFPHTPGEIVWPGL